MDGERYRLVNEGGFHCIDVAPVTAQDSGVWTCIATNLAGQAISKCHLNVLGKQKERFNFVEIVSFLQYFFHLENPFRKCIATVLQIKLLQGKYKKRTKLNLEYSVFKTSKKLMKFYIETFLLLFVVRKLFSITFCSISKQIFQFIK